MSQVDKEIENVKKKIEDAEKEIADVKAKLLAKGEDISTSKQSLYLFLLYFQTFMLTTYISSFMIFSKSFMMSDKNGLNQHLHLYQCNKEQVSEWFKVDLSLLIISLCIIFITLSIPAFAKHKW